MYKTLPKIPNTAHNRRIKYAWLRYMRYSIEDSYKLCRRKLMPLAFYEDLDSWFFYIGGKFIRDFSNGRVNGVLSGLCENSLTVKNTVLE